MRTFAFARWRGPVLLVLLGGWAGQLGARAQPLPAPDSSATLPLTEYHVWRVEYDDQELGRVGGTALIDWKYQQAQVHLHSPVTGEEKVLTSLRFTPPTSSTPLELVLRGESPNFQAVVAPSTAALVNASAATGADLTARRSDSELKATVGVRDFADDTVTVTLATEDEDLGFIGHWHYRADPLTERTRSGGGRVGAFTMPAEDSAHFLGMQTGREEWTLLRPKLLYVAVLEDQAQQGPAAATYGYPLPLAKSEPGIGGRINPWALRRRLLIVGQNLPLWPDPQGHAHALEPIKSDRADLIYGQPSLLMPPKAGEALDPDIEHAWQEATAGMDAVTALAIRQLPAAVVEVTFTAGVLPGVAEFTWEGEHAQWALQFGNNTAELRVVRTIRDGEQEATPVVFLPEQLAVEIETAQVLPVDAIKVYAAKNGAFLADPMVAVRSAPGSRVYRSSRFTVAGSGAERAATGTVLAAQTGDHLTFVAEQQRALLFGAVQTDVTVYNDPSELSLTWHHALSVCAQIAGKPPADFATLPGQQVEALTRVFVFSWALNRGSNLSLTSDCTLSLGQHAAMLMLRDVFVELSKRQVAHLQTTANDPAAVLGFGKIMAQALRRAPTSFFSTLPAGTLDGQPCTLLRAVDDVALKQAFGPRVEELRRWKIDAFRTALTSYSASLQESQNQAAAIANEQRADLLKLTGRGFGAVEAQLRPRLMRLDPAAHRWVPDTLARGYVASISAKEQELEDLNQASKIDTKLTVGIASALASLPVIVSESAVASFLTWAGNGLLWAGQSVAEAWEVHEAKTEVDFALGAASVLGYLRYDEAKLLDTPWWKVATSVILQGVAANLQAVDVLAKYNRAVGTARGVKTLLELDGGVEALRQLPRAQLADIEAGVMEIKALAVAGRTLSSEQASALFAWDKYATEAAAAAAVTKADWLKTLRLNRAFLVEDQGVVLTAAALKKNPLDPESVAIAHAALTRRNDLRAAVQTMQSEVEQWKVAETLAEGPARKAIATQIKAQQARLAIISDALAAGRLNPATLPRYADAEIAWITGVQKEIDLPRMEALLSSNSHSWAEIKSGFEHGTISAMDMHQFVTWRGQQVDQLVDQVMAEVKTEMEALLGRPVVLTRAAFGSTNLTSDYDISVGGPGAERVVGRFNARFRAANQNLESAFVFDTNVYTDPVYKLFQSRSLAAGSLELGTVELDTVRQFVYDQMAMRKYVPQDIWDQHKRLLTTSADPKARPMLSFAFDQAEKGQAAAEALIAKYLAGQTGANAVYRAQNEAYAATLLKIDQWRLEMVRLDSLFSEKAHYTTLPPGEFLRDYPVYQDRLKSLNAMLAAKNTSGAQFLRATMEEQVIAQMRDAQGTALYFASEAYQAAGTIIHVVDELQGPLKRAVSLASLRGAPVKTSLDALSYLNSFNENRANMFKEFGHLGLFGGHELAAGEKLAAKSSKYFIRQLDAMKQAGVDLDQVVGPDVVALTVKIDAVRGELTEVAAALQKSGRTGEQFVQQVRDASDRLAAAGVQDRQFSDLASFLGPQCADLQALEGKSLVK